MTTPTPRVQYVRSTDELYMWPSGKKSGTQYAMTVDQWHALRDAVDAELAANNLPI